MSDSATARLIDISVTVSALTPRWPGSPPFEATRWLDLGRGDVATDTVIRCSVHLGTHIDAPSHFVIDGPTVESIALDALVGPCRVVDLPEGGSIGPDQLMRAWPGPGTERLLLRTPNSRYWAQEGSRFIEEFSSVSAEGAKWLVEKGVRLVGIDYLSIQGFADSPDTHLQLLRAGVVILEGIDLSGVAPGPYELLCLPLRVVGLEAAPARAVLRPIAESPKS